MSEQRTDLSGPDFGAGVAFSKLADDKPLLGHAQGEPVLLVKRGDALFAVGATCTHYGAPLVDGLVVGETIRCPWHHASFCLRTGAAERAPALDGVRCWQVEQREATVFVTGKQDDAASASPRGNAVMPKAIVIVGGGAAGNAAAEMLRREGYGGSITMLSADDSLPCDRPNLSKDYLAGEAQEDWIALRPQAFYEERKIDLRLNTRVEAVDTAARQVRLAGGDTLDYDALLLATGADPVQLDIPGAELPHVHTLRTWADSRALIARAEKAKRAVVIGASFIGLEVAASLRKRGIEVHVVASGEVPMQRVLGESAGRFVRKLHEEHGVRFHMGTTAVSIDALQVVLADGHAVAADLVVVGIGVKPALALAEAAGLAVDHGVTVDRFLATSVPGIYAAGDIARWPDAASGQPIRVEHWVVAERQGQVAARNMLGGRETFDMVPFFWTAMYDLKLRYIGHAEDYDEVVIDGSLAARDCKLSYRRGGKTLAVAVVGRDMEGLDSEVEFERATGALERG
ncbi:MAG: FAD-dependent oxidoreductase [Pseudomonadota bacterium]|nr:FAD-dependent oxidoreductase [Pseudomonadota bacterium]